MNYKEQILAFGQDLDALVLRYSLEFDLHYASIIGILNMKASFLSIEAYDAEDDDAEDDDAEVEN